MQSLVLKDLVSGELNADRRGTITTQLAARRVKWCWILRGSGGIKETEVAKRNKIYQVLTHTK